MFEACQAPVQRARLPCVGLGEGMGGHALLCHGLSSLSLSPALLRPPFRDLHRQMGSPEPDPTRCARFCPPRTPLTVLPPPIALPAQHTLTPTNQNRRRPRAQHPRRQVSRIVLAPTTPRNSFPARGRQNSRGAARRARARPTARHLLRLPLFFACRPPAFLRLLPHTPPNTKKTQNKPKKTKQ